MEGGQYISLGIRNFEAQTDPGWMAPERSSKDWAHCTMVVAPLVG